MKSVAIVVVVAVVGSMGEDGGIDFGMVGIDVPPDVALVAHNCF